MYSKGGEKRGKIKRSRPVVWRHCLSSTRWSTIQQNEIVRSLLPQKKAWAMCYNANLCKQLTCTEEAEREINIKHVCGSSRTEKLRK